MCFLLKCFCNRRSEQLFALRSLSPGRSFLHVRLSFDFWRLGVSFVHTGRVSANVTRSRVSGGL